VSSQAWQELDREANALAVSKFGCMGMAHIPSKLAKFAPPAWYGGQVLLAAKLSFGSNGLRLELLLPEIGASSRFTRRYGSDSILRVRVTRDVYSRSNNLELAFEFLHKPLVVFGRVYRLFYTNKEHVAFYFATNETTLALGPDRRFPSLLDFVDWFNPMSHNSEQVRYHDLISVTRS
jgi:RNA-dependent RNA polymerase